MPPLHPSLEAQRRPHAPQFPRSVCRSMQRPRSLQQFDAHGPLQVFAASTGAEVSGVVTTSAPASRPASVIDASGPHAASAAQRHQARLLIDANNHASNRVLERC
jgi:hypothetical protein